MQYIDHLGITANMSPQEKFDFLQKVGVIPQNEKFENWTFEDYPEENIKDADRKQKSTL